MSNAKHASGPWVVGEDDELNGCPFIPIVAADGVCIAEVVPDYSEDHPHLGERERATANLIAAAQETLDALLYCVERDPGLKAHPNVMAAISKAEGRDNA